MIRYLTLTIAIGLYLLTSCPVPLYALLILSIYSILASLYLRAAKVYVYPKRVLSHVGSTAVISVIVDARVLGVEIEAPTYVDGRKVVEVKNLRARRNRADVELILLKRGVYRISKVKLVLSDPFSLAKVRRECRVEIELVITPRPLGSAKGRGEAFAEGEFFELRDYVPHDDARRIDWKATARLRKPMVREYRGVEQRIITVLLDATASMALSGRLESAILEIQRMALESPVMLTVFNEAGVWSSLVDRRNVLEVLARPNPVLGRRPRKRRVIELKKRMLRLGKFDVVYTDVV